MISPAGSSAAWLMRRPVDSFSMLLLTALADVVQVAQGVERADVGVDTANPSDNSSMMCILRGVPPRD